MEETILAPITTAIQHQALNKPEQRQLTQFNPDILYASNYIGFEIDLCNTSYVLEKDVAWSNRGVLEARLLDYYNIFQQGKKQYPEQYPYQTMLETVKKVIGKLNPGGNYEFLKVGRVKNWIEHDEYNLAGMIVKNKEEQRTLTNVSKEQAKNLRDSLVHYVTHDSIDFYNDIGSLVAPQLELARYHPTNLLLK